MAFNAANQSVRRLQSEFRALSLKPESDFVAGPVGDDLFLWHFTIKGAKDTPFEGGIYHGKIVFPPQYPMKPPDIYFFTPNGRFETHQKLCLTFTSYHPEQWNPAWDVRTAMTAVIAFMVSKAEGAIGAIEMSDKDRRALAVQSRSWKCKECDYHIDPDPLPSEAGAAPPEEGEEQAPEEGAADAVNTEEEQAHEEQEEEKKEEGDEKKVEEEEAKQEDKQEQKGTEEEEAVGQEEKKQDGMVHYEYEELQRMQAKKKPFFMPLLDIPIVILFVMLLVVIADNTFDFLKRLP